MAKDSTATRQSIIDGCLWMQSVGLNQGTSGNIAVRIEGGMLITPSAVPYRDMTPDMIVTLALDAPPASGQNPSTEWQFHQAVLKSRPDVGAVVHAHPAHATAVSIQRRAIPAVHYMVAAFGGSDVLCTDYALFGSAALSQMVADAMMDRDGCLMANHGALTAGDSLDRALWRMQELESLARVMLLAEASGTPVMLSDADIQDTLASFAGYGLRASEK
ncbi:class II aldolase/adducin family protein [Octadecabacter sp. G9-8]|uniref:Class II aldolase/adducin family protein n=1 Tax=Octadecabacter dasysiphoniae TaxID=2909341 RepID=A0ABS9CSY6_9RHOB|nr:class II aldolase/adducin family protein [Octadecabacter dasysiphoniae]MCF2869550.1 class II aldolase/adducin family protein [Octadecabacter dasysiphoniae]